MKRFMSSVLTLALTLTMIQPAFAIHVDDDPISPDELDQEIANGTAIVENEVRDLASFTTEEIQNDAGLQSIFSQINRIETRSVNSGSATGKLYQTTITASTGDIITYRSTPSTVLSVSDVGTASSSDISSEFKVSSSVTVNGSLSTLYLNYIRYKNIRASVGCGANTAFTHMVSVDGVNGSGSSLDFKAIVGMLANAAGYTTVSQIVSAFSAIQFSDSTYTTSKSVSGGKVRAVGLKWKPAIFNSGDTLGVYSSVSTVDSSLAANATANSAAKWTFDVYYGAGSPSAQYSDVSLSPQTSYKVNVK